MAADWTVMVYLAGDNNLTAECIYALTEMKKVDLNSRVNVIVQFDPQDEYLPTRRFKITHDLSPGKLLNDDKGGAPFKESVNARRRERARAAALKAGKTAVSAAALKSLENEHMTASNNPISVTAKKVLGKNIEIELLGDVAHSNGIETDYWLGGLSVDQSALKLIKVDELKNRVDALADALIKELKTEPTEKNFCDALIMAHWETQSYNGEQFVDLADFCQSLKVRYPANGIPKLCQDVLDSIQGFVLKSCYSGPTYQFSYGVSIYFPWAQVAPSYKELSFAQTDSGWAEFLGLYTGKTRRLPRIAGATSQILNQEAIARFESVNSSRTPQMFRKTDDKGTGNPIRSMRNPPLFALPDDCIRERESIIKELDRFFKELLKSQSGY